MQEPDPVLEALLKPLPCAREPLMRHIVGMVDEGMIARMARCDYGSAIAENDTALREIIQRAEAPSHINFVPGEVLELTRWERPDDPNWHGWAKGTHGHIMRAFACASLLHSQSCGIENQCNIVAPLIESVLALGDSLPRETLAFLNWCVQDLQHEREQRLFIVLGILILVAQVQEELPHAQLIYWIMLESDALRRGDMAFGPRLFWDVTNFDQYFDVWVSLIKRVLVNDSVPDEVRLFGRKLVDYYERKD